MTLIEREDVDRPIALSEYDVGGVGKPYTAEIGVLFHDALRLRDVRGREGFEPVRTRRHLVKQREFGLYAYRRCQQMIELSEYERGEEQWSYRSLKSLSRRPMQALVRVDSGKQPARV